MLLTKEKVLELIHQLCNKGLIITNSNQLNDSINKLDNELVGGEPLPVNEERLKQDEYIDKVSREFYKVNSHDYQLSAGNKIGEHYIVHFYNEMSDCSCSVYLNENGKLQFHQENFLAKT